MVTAAGMGAPGSRNGHGPSRTRQGTEMFSPWPQSASAARKVIIGREFKLETKKATRLKMSVAAGTIRSKIMDTPK